MSENEYENDQAPANKQDSSQGPSPQDTSDPDAPGHGELPHTDGETFSNTPGSGSDPGSDTPQGASFDNELFDEDTFDISAFDDELIDDDGDSDGVGDSDFDLIDSLEADEQTGPLPFTGSDESKSFAPIDEQRQVVLVKHGHRYVFRYERGEESKVLHSLVDMARDPESDLDWFDAAVLSHQLGERMSQQLQNLRRA